MRTVIHSVHELDAFAKSFAKTLAPLPDVATVLALSGELGAGKTAFTQALARALGVEEVVNSPTFVLEKLYALPRGSAFEKLVHIDAYRLENEDELAPLGFDTLVADPTNLIVLEWPEHVTRAVPAAARALVFAVADDGSRNISYGA